MLLMNSDEFVLEKEICFVTQTLFWGFLINEQKSILKPPRFIEFLGVHLNSIDLTFSLPEAKKEEITLFYKKA